MSLGNNPTIKSILHYHILEGILIHLSASDSARFLAILGLLHEQGGSLLSERYVRPLRDIPEHAAWVEMMISRGHRAFIIGSDLPRWIMRLRDPLGYWERYCGASGWEERPLRLWLAMRVSQNLFKQPHPLSVEDDTGYRHYAISMNGEAVYGPEIKKLQEDGKVLTKANVIPLLGGSRASNETTMNSQDGEWRRSSEANMNNLQIVWAHFEDAIHKTPRVQMCPLQASERGPMDVMRGSHGAETYRCESLQPGSLVKPSRTNLNMVIPVLPYLDLSSGQQGLAKNIEPLARRDEEDQHAFVVEFRCRGNKVSVARDTQGIPWNVLM